MEDERRRRPVRRYEARSELRADTKTRRVEGVAVRYGDVAVMVPGPGGYEETIAPGAFSHPGGIDGNANVTFQHKRELPLALPTWADSDEAMRLSFVMPPGARQDQVLSDVSAGTVRGLSIEFFPDFDTETKEIVGDDVMRFIVNRAELVGVSMVDVPAYPDSEFEIRARLARFRTRPRRTRDRVRRALCIG